MARNRIQFQKGLSEAQFRAPLWRRGAVSCGVTSWRWPEGFPMPSVQRERPLYGRDTQVFSNATACRRQTSPTAGTIFDSTKLPLTAWFRAMYLITQTKQGISSIELGRRLGTTQTTAWKIKTKLAEVMRARATRSKPRRPRRNGRRLSRRAAERRQARPRQPRRSAVYRGRPDRREGRPQRIKLGASLAFQAQSVKSLTRRIIAPGATSSPTGSSAFMASPMPAARTCAIVTGSGLALRAIRHSSG